MKLKTKLNLGVGALFFLITLLGVIGIRNALQHGQDTRNILQANYQSLLFTRQMLAALDDRSEAAWHSFEKNLKLQENNITEPGEQAITRQLRGHFERHKAQGANPDPETVLSIRKALFEITDMNMKAIERKSEKAQLNADHAVILIALSGTLCFLIAFTLLVNLPSSIARSVEELTESIQEIASQNYARRVQLSGHSEFAQLAQSFNSMAEKLEEYNNSNLARLMIEKKRIEALINHMKDPVIGVDQNLIVLFANKEALKVCNIQLSDIMGLPLKQVAEKNDLLRSLALDLQDATQIPNTKQRPIKIFSGNKEGYFEKEIYHLSIAPTGEQEQLMMGHVIILRNVTEYKAQNDAKSHFIATVSHEFKTPISSIQLCLQLLEDNRTGALNEEQKNLILSIKEEAGRLLKFTGELLRMAQVESGNIQLTIVPANVGEIIQYAVQATKAQAEQKKIRINIECPDQIPQIMADSEKTAWVLVNLISNAIRYAYEEAAIYITAAIVHNSVCISVRDQGRGIAPQYKDKIFDRYFRVPGATREGTGLGLAISKEFMEAQGGQIRVESEIGKGSVFTICLGMAEPART